MIGIDTPIPIALVVLWALVLLVLTLLAHRRLRYALPGRICWAVSALRVAAAAIVLILLLQPYRLTKTPDREGFRLAVLADCSQSMSVRDLPNRTERLELVRQSLGTERDENLIQRLSERYRSDVRTFAEDVRVHTPGSPLPFLPGPTAIGDALTAVLNERAPAPLGGVLLLSDGHSNAGMPPDEACKLYRGRGIPISTVGIGRQRRTGDVRLHFTTDRIQSRKDEEATLTVMLENHFDREVASTLTLSDGTETIAERRVTIPAQGTSEESFTVKPWRAGFMTYRASIQEVTGDPRPDNNVDYAGVDVREPDTFRVLFLGGHLSWEYRFLKLLTDGNRQLSLAAAIHTGPGNIYQVGVAEDAGAEGRLETLPSSADQLNRFEAIVLDTRAVPLLGEEGIEALTAFVDRRGGGLLVMGPLQHLPESMDPLVTVPEIPAAMLSQRQRLDVNPEFIFDQDPAGILDDHAGLPLDPGGPVFFTEMLKRSAREAAGVRHTDLVALSAHSYGSGRAAYLGMEATWQWRLQNAEGQADHTAFWNALLVWLASSSQQRVSLLANGSKTGVGEALDLDVDVLGRDFRPAPDAQVSATVTGPAGSSVDVALDAAPATPGRYQGVFFPNQPGEHRVRYRIRTAEDDLTRDVHILARQMGLETEDTGYREDVLRDIARITGGTFFSFDDLAGIDRIPLSDEVPMQTARRHWTRHLIWIALLFACLGTEWVLRRRVGLK